MVFSSLIFLYLFLPICMLLYVISPSIRMKNGVLILFSLIFYAWGEPLNVILLVISALINWACGMLIDIWNKEGKTGKKRFAMILAIVVDLGLLGLFKYAGFLVENLNAITGLSIRSPGLVMPIGISFYTFQALTYVIDIYRGNVKVQRSYPRFLLYIALFPQLIAGPIVRYSDIEVQLQDRKVTSDGFFTGLTRFCVGLGKKVLIANYCGEMTARLLDGKTAGLTTVGAWLGILLYTFQIYFDFSGYSDMAIGMGRMFGFEYLENFNYPYMSKSITEFWRRWHISLSSFFRDYVYIPLGGNRKHVYLNLLIVWALTGLWHGASWNFVLWGLYFFVLLCIERIFKKALDHIPGVIRYIITMILVIFGWTLFYFTDLHDVWNTFAAMFGFGAGVFNTETKINLISTIPLLILAAVGSTSLPKTIGMITATVFAGGKSSDGEVRSSMFYILTFLFDLAVLILATVSLVGSSYNPFLYFRF